MCYQEFQQTNMTRMVNLWKGGGVAKSAIPPPSSQTSSKYTVYTAHSVFGFVLLKKYINVFVLSKWEIILSELYHKSSLLLCAKT